MQIGENKMAHILDTDSHTLLVQDDSTGEEMEFKREELWRLVQFALVNGVFIGMGPHANLPSDTKGEAPTSRASDVARNRDF